MILVCETNANLAVNLTSILDLSASSNLNISNRKPEKINNDKLFHEESKILRKKLRNLSNQKHRDSEPQPSLWWITKTIQTYNTEKEGTARLKSAQCNWRIHRLLENPKQTELSIQHENEWVNHFSNLYGPTRKNKQQKPDQIHILESTIQDYQNPLDYPITLNELQDKIQTLQPKKSCGVGVLNEMIKYTDHKFQLAILKLL